MMRWAGVALFAFLGLTVYWHFSSGPGPADFTGWATDTTKRVIDLDELIPGCPERDCIPSIDDPAFESISHGDEWLDARAPVAVLTMLPLPVMSWSEFRPDTRVVRH